MTAQWFRMTLRLMARHRLYAAINLFGLAVGLAAALLILIFVRHETAYERHYVGADRIYRLAADWPQEPGEVDTPDVFVQQPMADLIRSVADRVGVEAASRFENGRLIVQRDGTPLFQPVGIVDPDFFRIFDFAWVAGDPATALATPDGLVLSVEAAQRLFGDVDPMDRTVTLSGGQSLRVTGIIEAPKAPTAVWFDGYISTAAPFMGQPQWINSNGPVYLLAKPGVSRVDLAGRLNAVVPPLIPPHPMIQNQADITLVPEPIRDTHLWSGRWTNSTDPPADAATVFAMAGVALLLLGMAAINYTNLATARASLRTREVGLRKTVGARRRQLIAQFLGESVLVALAGLVLALVLVELLAPAFADLIDIRLYFSPWSDPVLLSGAVLLTLGVGVLGGAYPALYLSRVRPTAALRAGLGGVGGAGRLRAILVVVQFAFAVGLAAATLVVAQQTRYAATADLGFDKDNRLILSWIGGQQTRQRLEPLKQELLAIPGVEAAAASWMVPGGQGNQSRELRPFGAPESAGVNTELTRVEHNFLDVLGVRMLAGRGFDPARGEDEMKFADGATGPLTFSVILNASSVKSLGFATPEEALGQVLHTSDDTPVPTLLRVIGVVEDFRPRTARREIRPAMYVFGDPVYRYNFLTLKLSPQADLPAVLNAVDRTWNRFVPTVPVTRTFLDDSLERMYERERRIAGILGGFAGLTMAIACLGLFALAAFEAERRTKEIGVRKVLGATVVDIVGLLSWRFSRPVLVANLIAWPVTWLAASHWLSGFAHRMDLTPWPFLLAGMGALLIAWMTVAGHAARVASRPPVHALRYE